MIKHLLALAADPLLQAAWLRAEQVPALSSAQILDETALRQLKQRLRHRRRQKAQLTRKFLERADADGVIEAAAYWELVGAISDEIAELEKRLREAEAALPEPAELASSAALDLQQAMRSVFTGSTTSEAVLVRRSALAAALVREVIVDEVTPGLIEVEVVPFLDSQ